MSAGTIDVPTTAQTKVRWFVPGDLDGFFGLFFSGFPDLLLIAGLAPLCGFPTDLVATRIMPAVALSILGGNIFYAWQAHRLAETTHRTDVTAIPFGVNTPTIFAYVFLIMLPVYQRSHDSESRVAHGRVCLLCERYCADRGSVLHGLAAAPYAAGGAAVPVGGNCHRLSVSWIRPENFSDAGTCPVAGGHHSCGV